MHVLTGPDHLSAIATLSSTESNKLKSFLLGVRWGIGHSTGLLLVGSIILCVSTAGTSTDRNDDTRIEVPDRVGNLFEALVGVFMICLGIHSIRRARTRQRHGLYTTLLDPEEDQGEVNPDAEMQTLIPQDEEASTDGQESTGNSFTKMLAQLASSLSTQTLAVVAGIIHGFAGPGGVLGVIPAVKLHDGLLSTIYFSSFCVSSTLTMGIFALLYGTLSRSIGHYIHNEYSIEVFSACLSVFVGLLWLVLLYFGILDKVFP